MMFISRRGLITVKSTKGIFGSYEDNQELASHEFQNLLKVNLHLIACLCTVAQINLIIIHGTLPQSPHASFPFLGRCWYVLNKCSVDVFCPLLLSRCYCSAKFVTRTACYYNVQGLAGPALV